MGETQSTQRDEKGDAAAEEESVQVDDVHDDENIEDKLLHKNGLISGLTANEVDPAEEVNGVCEDLVDSEVCETIVALVSPKDDVSDALETVEEGIEIEGPPGDQPEVNIELRLMESPEDASKETHDVTSKETRDDIPKETPYDTSQESPDDITKESPDDITMESPDDITMESPDDITMESPDDITKESPEDDSKPSMSEAEAKLNEINESFRRFFSMVGFKLTVKKDKAETEPEGTTEKEQGEGSSPEDSEYTTVENIGVSAKQSADLSPEPESSEKTSPSTTEDITVEEVKETFKEKTEDAEETIEEAPCDRDGAEEPAEVILDGKEATPDQEPTSHKEAEEPDATSPDELEAMSPIKRFFTTGIFSGLGKKKKSKEEEKAKDKCVDKELVDIEKPQDVVTAEEDDDLKTNILPTSDKVTAEVTEIISNNMGNISEEQTAVAECSSPVISNKAELLSSQEKEKIEGSPLKKLLSGASLKKLSKRQRSKKSTETQLTESEEDSAAQLQSSTESAEYQRDRNPACSPEGAVERENPMVSTQLNSSHESEGDANSDGERRKDGTWASFKKLVTPKRRPKRPSLCDDEAAAVAPLDETKTGEGEEIITLSTEEYKNKVDWESFLCGSGKRRSRKTSDSEEEAPLRASQRADDGPKDTVESPLESSQDVDSETVSSSPEQAGSPAEGDGGSTWKSLKRLVTPKRKAKNEEVCREQIPSDSEISKDDSSFSIKKLLSGRKKRKTDGKHDQISSDEADRGVGSDEDSETPAVIPLSEFDMEPAEDHTVLTQVVIESSPTPAETVDIQQDMSSQLTDLVTPSIIPPSEPESAQDNEDTVVRSSTPVEEFEDLTEYLSKHQQLSDIPEEGAIEETVATPMSTAEEFTRDDTLAEDLIELTSEAVTAMEPIDDSLADETTEMVSAVSQLTESSKTSGNTTPVPAEHDFKETGALLQEVVETMCVPSETFAVTSNDADMEKVLVSVDPQVFGISAGKETTILETHAKLDSICVGLDINEFSDPLNEPTVALVECLLDTREAISTELAPETNTEFEAAGIATDEVHKADVVVALEKTDFVDICTDPESEDLITTDESQTSTEGVFEVSEAQSEDYLEEEFGATATDNFVLLENVEPQEKYDTKAIWPAPGPDELNDIDESKLNVEGEIKVTESNAMPWDKLDESDSAVNVIEEVEQAEELVPQAISTSLDTEELNVIEDSQIQVECEIQSAEGMPEDKPEEFDSVGNVSKLVEQAESLETQAISTGLDINSFVNESLSQEEVVTGVNEAIPSELKIENETEEVDLKYTGEMTKTLEVVVKDQITELFEETQVTSPVHVASMDPEVIGVQVLETQIADDIEQPYTEIVSLSNEPLCIQEANFTDVTVEEEKEDLLDEVEQAENWAPRADFIRVEGEIKSAEAMPEDKHEEFDLAVNVLKEVEPEIMETQAFRRHLDIDSVTDESLSQEEVVTGVNEAIPSDLKIENETGEGDIKYTGEMIKTQEVVDEDQITELFEETQVTSPVHVATMVSEVVGVQVLETQIAEDIPQPDAEIVSLSNEPLCIQEANITDVAVEEERGQDLQSVEQDMADVKYAPVEELITCKVVEDTTSIPDTPMEETSEVSERLIAIVATGVEIPDIVDTVGILSPQLNNLTAQTAEVGDEVALKNVPLSQPMSGHEIQVEVTYVDIETAGAVVETVLETVSTNTVEVLDVCGEEEKAVDTSYATLEIEEDITEEAGSVTTQEIHQHEMEVSKADSAGAPRSDKKVDSESTSDAKVHLSPDTTVETGRPHISILHESADTAAEIFPSAEKYLEIEPATEAAGVPREESYVLGALVVEEDTVNNDSLSPQNLAEIPDQEHVRNLKGFKVEPKDVGVATVPEDSKYSEAFDVERRREEETEEKMTQTVAPLVERSRSAGVVSSAVNLGTPSSLTLEVKLNFQFGETKEAVNTHNSAPERAEPLKYTDSSEAGVQTTEEFIPIEQKTLFTTPNSQTEIIEPARQTPEVHKTLSEARQTGETTRQAEEEPDEDVWLDAQENIDIQDGAAKTWSKAAEFQQGQKSCDYKQSKIGKTDHEVPQDWNVMDPGEGSGKETLKPDETEMEREDTEVFGVALGPSSFSPEVEAAKDTSITAFD